MKRISHRTQYKSSLKVFRQYAKEIINLADAKRRKGWLVENLTPRKFINIIIAFAQFVLKRQFIKAWPIIVKVDISPLCNLSCTICVHARPAASSSQGLKDQSFKADQKMSLDQFKRIVDEISGKSMAVSMYYLGDPLVHPDLEAMCRIARDGGLNSHVSTNFSFQLSDERIRRLVTSGLTHLTVCVDGLSQETYERTRVGGRLDVVLDNLERVIKCRRELGRVYPKVEAQFIKFQHNIGELEQAVRYCLAIGVDQFTDFWGDLANYTDFNPGKYKIVKPKKKRGLPQCFWPYFALQIKYNGDVIPCCKYRIGLQYTDSKDKRIVGNVFKTSLWDVWNSTEYKALRRFVSNPERVNKERELAESFCDGCPTIFETEYQKLYLKADNHRWEDFYNIDERHRVARKQSA